MPDPIQVNVYPNVNVVQVTKPGTGNGSTLEDLSPSPVGTYPFATVTVDSKGRTIAVSAGTDVASESTQQSIQNDVTQILNAVNGLSTNGLTGNTVTEEP